MMHRSALSRSGGSALVSMPMPLGLPAALPPIANDRGGHGDLRLEGDALGRKRAKRRLTRQGQPKAPATAPATVPQSAASIGQGERFRYWQGASGRRYLFSRVEVDELSTFDDAVVILEVYESRWGAARMTVARMEPDRRLVDRAGNLCRAHADAAFVHLLAHDAAARVAAMDDILAAL